MPLDRTGGRLSLTTHSKCSSKYSSKYSSKSSVSAELSAARLAVATKSADKASESEIARLRAEKVEADKSVQDMQRHMTDKDTCECLVLTHSLTRLH
jgi:hypothetical protein